MRVLLVEDEPKIAGFVRQALTEQGFDVVWETDGDAAFDRARREAFDVLVLDIMLPGRDGLSIVRQLREARNAVPVILLTARSALDERVEGLNVGADDYLTKPFYVEELIARLHAVTRRGGEERLSVLQCDDLVVDLIARTVRRGDRDVALTPREFSLLEHLMHRRGRVLPRTQLLEHVWGLDFDPGSNVVDVCVQRLRRKLDPSGDGGFIETVRGVGYRFRR